MRAELRDPSLRSGAAGTPISVAVSWGEASQITSPGQRAWYLQLVSISPWYSIRQRDGNVYHDHAQCPVGANIEEKYRRAGRRCRARCRVCTRLHDPSHRSPRLESMPV